MMPQYPVVAGVSTSTPSAYDGARSPTWKITSGGHRSEGSTSFEAILATFIPTFTTAVIFLVIFVLIRGLYRHIYAPRTFLDVVPDKDKTPSSSRTALSWLRDFRNLDDKFVLRHNSLDGYLFLRFFKIMVFMCFVGCCLTWPILFAVNATGGGTAKQLDRISFSNIADSNRLYAHAIVAWLFLGFVMITVARERIFVVNLREAHLTSKSNAARLSSKVVLFMSVPAEALHDENLQRTFGDDAKRSWVVSKHDKLEALVKDRNEKAQALEVAEVTLIRDVNKEHLKDPSKTSVASQVGNGNGAIAISIEDASRPKHKTHTLVGKEIDTIEELRTVIPEVCSMIEQLRKVGRDKKEKHTSAVFVEYNNQAAAHEAYQKVQHHHPLRLWPRCIGVQPKEVIWSNLTMHPSDRVFRSYLAIAFVAATIILWSIPIGVVAAISNIDYLTDKVHFLRFVDRLPDPVLGFLKGFLPPYLMSTFVSYVPKFFLYIAKLTGEPTLPAATIRTQQWYFAFQVIQVFLVTTFSSGAAAVVTKIINQPTRFPDLLASSLPKASNFYLSYFILQGTASAAKNVLNYSDLLEYLAYDKFFDKTPRQQYTRYTSMKGLNFGSNYPKFANMAVIAIAYSCIAPLVLGFATVGLFLFYLSFRYNLMYVMQVKVDTKGECYSRALQHMLTGVYLSELCLIGLFSAREAIGPTVLIIILLVATIIYHITFNRFVGPLEMFLPLDVLAAEEEAPLLAAEEGMSDNTLDQPASRVKRIGQGKIPHHVLNPIAKFLEPQVFEDHRSLQTWLHDPTRDEDEQEPIYTDEEMRTAYMNPALISKTPKLWLVKDDTGMSKREIASNEKVGITATDEGARLDKKNHIVWDHIDLGNTPVFKRPVKY